MKDLVDGFTYNGISLTTTLIYNSDRYIVWAAEFPNNFFNIDNIYAFGLKPEVFDVTSMRDYAATFAINNNELVLNKLFTNNGYNIENEPPLINNKLPKISASRDRPDGHKSNWRDFTYEDVNLPLDYTGSIIITKDFINDNRYSHLSELCSLILYSVVLQLSFNKGKLVSDRDLSDVASSARNGDFKKYDENEKKTPWMDNYIHIFFTKDEEKEIAQGIFFD